MVNILFEIFGILCPVFLFFLIHLLRLCSLLLQIRHVRRGSRLCVLRSVSRFSNPSTPQMIVKSSQAKPLEVARCALHIALDLSRREVGECREKTYWGDTTKHPT